MSENPEASITQAQRQASLDRYGLTPAEAGHEMLLQMIEDHFAEGLETKVEPFPETDREFGALLDELRPLSADQLLVLREEGLHSCTNLLHHGAPVLLQIHLFGDVLRAPPKAIFYF